MVWEEKEGLMRLNDWKLWTVLVVVLFLGGLGYYFRPVVEEGVIAAKSITGERNNVHYTIIRFHELGVNPKIDDWETLFPNTTKISEEVESELKTRIQESISGIRVYVDIKYLVSIRTEDVTMAYFVSREDFNKVDPGDTVKFKILRRRDPTVKIIEVIAQGE